MDTNNVKFEMACGLFEQLPESMKPEVVFSGRSNVGKSSLINKLTNRKSLARVSATPGKTATINFFSLSEFMLVDLPGYGYAKVSHAEKERWAELVEGYFGGDRKFALIVQICDIRHKPTVDDMQMIEYLSAMNFPFIVVLTKMDKLNKTELAKQTEYYRELLKDYNVQCFPFSALKGTGTEEIRDVIDKYIEMGEWD